MKLRLFNPNFWKNLFTKESPTPISPPEVEEANLPEIEEETKKEIKPTEISAIVRSELNLEKNSIFTVSTYRGKSREIKQTEKLPTGETIERTVIVGKTKDSIETGILTIYHFKVYLALIELWEKAGKPVNETVHFTIYKLIKRLDLSDDGRTYEKVKVALYNLRQIPIEFIESFYLSEENSFTTLEPFSILDRLRIYERRSGKKQKTRGYGEFRFDDHILDNLMNNYVHPLRLDVIKSFKKHKDLSILIYTYLDRQLAYKDKFEVGLATLFDELDLSQDHIRYPSDRKVVINPILDELRTRPLSTGILSHVNITKTKDGLDYKLVSQKLSFKAPQFTNNYPAKQSNIQKVEKSMQDEDEDPFTGQVQEYRAKLTESESKELREKAIEELKNTPGILEVFITDTLIEIKENEIIRAIITEDAD